MVKLAGAARCAGCRAGLGRARGKTVATPRRESVAAMRWELGTIFDCGSVTKYGCAGFRAERVVEFSMEATKWQRKP